MKKWLLIIGLPLCVAADAIDDINHHLNQIQSLKADVCQSFGDGRQIKGTLTLKRPGHIKLTYQKPAPYFFVCDGKACVYQDALMERPLFMAPERLPLSFLMDHTTDLRQHFLIKKLTTEPTGHRLEVATKDQMLHLCLTFSTKGQLTGWQTTDPEGNIVHVTLDHIKLNPVINDGVFAFQQMPRWLQKNRRRV